jgi:hypothetical protein
MRGRWAKTDRTRSAHWWRPMDPTGKHPLLWLTACWAWSAERYRLRPPGKAPRCKRCVSRGRVARGKK